jgi:hypothetical protein
VVEKGHLQGNGKEPDENLAVAPPSLTASK